jgi:hypothetical protein
MIAYDRLSKIVPADQALACKALSVALQNIGGVPNMELPTLADAVTVMETTKDLPMISQQTQPITNSTKVFVLTTLGLGTGPCGTITTEDMLGTASGHVVAGNLLPSITALQSLNTSYIQLGYSNMVNTTNGAFDYHVPNPDYNPLNPEGPGNLKFLGWAVVVPSGPGAGTYGIYPDQISARNAAFIQGLLPGGRAAGFNYVNTPQGKVLNSNWGNISQQIGNEQDLQKRAGLNFADVYANIQTGNQPAIFSFIYSLPGYGQNKKKDGPAQFLEEVANYNPTTGTLTAGSRTITSVSTMLGLLEFPFTPTTTYISGQGIPAESHISAYNWPARTITSEKASTISQTKANLVIGTPGGQAVVATMRQGTNFTASDFAGILLQSGVPLGTNPPAPDAVLLPTQYSVQEAVRKITI